MSKKYISIQFGFLIFIFIFFQTVLFAKNIYIDKDVKGIEVNNTSNSKKTFQLFSHGRSGELLIDGKWLDAKQIAEFLKITISHQPSTINHLNIYGCEFGKGFKGLEAVNYLEKELGVSVSASTNITGFDGDWILEIGQNKDVIALNNYQGNLQTCGGVIGGMSSIDDYDGDGICNKDDLDDDNDGILDTDENVCTYLTSAFVHPSDLTWDKNGIPFPGVLQSNKLPNVVTASSTISFGPGFATAVMFSNAWQMTGADATTFAQAKALNEYMQFTIPTSAYTTNYVLQNWLTYSIGGAFQNLGIEISTDPTFATSTKLFEGANANAAGYTSHALQVEYKLLNGVNYYVRAYPFGTLKTILWDAFGLDTYCLVDTDQDGIPNIYDIDSDNDGCSDAIESGVSGTLLSSGSGMLNSIAQSPYGTNGLANGVETAIDSGIINYVSKYQYAITKGVNACTDTDGDGISDIVDLDDDNDGILDAVESPNCFYSFNQATTKTISSDLTINNASFPLSNAIDNSAITYTAIVTNQNWVNKALYQINLAQPVLINGLTFTNGNGNSVSNNATSTFRLEGSNDGINWIPLSASMSSITNVTFTLANSLQPTQAYSKYRIAGVTGTNGYANTYNIALNYGTYIASANPIAATCNDDADGDGIPNNLDLDSDNDGCSDANEYYSSLNASGTDGGMYGTGTPVVKTDGTVTAASYIGNYAYAILKSNNSSCLDTDGDGINDLVDIDDDNDGILDEVESPNCFYTLAQATTKTISSDLTLYSASGYPLTYAIDGDLTTVTAIDINQYWVNKALYQINLAQPVPMTGLTFTNGNGNAVSYDATSTFRLEGSNDGINWIPLSTSISSTANVTFTLSNSLQPTQAYSKYRIAGVTGTNGYANTYNIALNYGAYIASVHPIGTICNDDADGDGIPNHLDLDSDNDGCSDANEYYFSPLASGTDGGMYGTGTPVVKIDGTVTAAAYIGSYANAIDAMNQDACQDCDHDGIPNKIDIDDDNDGVLDSIECPSAQASNGDMGTLSAAILAGTAPSKFKQVLGNLTLQFEQSVGTISSFTEAVSGPNTLYATGTPTNYIYPSGSSTQIIKFTDTATGLPTTVNSTFLITDIDQLGENYDITIYDQYGAIILNPISYIKSTVVGTSGTYPSGTASTFTDLGTNVTKATVSSGNAVNLKSVLNNSAATYLRANVIYFDFSNVLISKIVIKNNSTVISNAPGFLFNTVGKACTNNCNLDSDNDGCSDAYEAGATTSLDPNYTFPGPYGANGLANSIENNDTATASTSYTQTYTTNALNAAIKSCCGALTAGPDKVACKLGSVSMSAINGLGIGTWTAQAGNPGTATIATATSAISAISGFTNSGTFVFVWSNGSCSDTVSIVVNPLPDAPTFGIPIQPTCSVATGSFVISNYINTNTYTITPAGATLNTTTGIVTAPAGTYTITAANIANSCTSVSSNIIINVQPPMPVVTPITTSGPTTFCSGSNIILTAPIAPSGQTYYFQWYKDGVAISGATNYNYTALASGSYTVTSTTSLGCVATSIATVVTVNQLPPAAISSGAILATSCSGSVTLNANAGVGFTYKWYKDGVLISGATLASYSTTVTGNYTVEVANGNGCKSLSAATNVIAPPTLSTNGTLAACQGSSINLTATSIYGSDHFQWSLNGITISGATSSTYIATTSGQYTCTVTNNGGQNPATTCPITIQINLNPTPTITVTGTASVCAGSTVPLSTGLATTYQWLLDGNAISGATSQNYSASQSGNYTVLVSNSSGCQTTSSATTVTIVAKPAVPVLNTIVQPTCSVATGSFTIINYNPANTYNISPTGATLNTSTGIVTAPAGTYSVFANVNGCPSASSNSITINSQLNTPATPILGSLIQPTCAVATGSFTINNYSLANTYTITPSGTTLNTVTGIVTAPAGTYSVIANTNGCISPTSTAKIESQPATPSMPTLEILNQPTCAVATGSFAISNYDSINIYTIAPVGATLNTTTGIVTAQAGTYTVNSSLITGLNTCTIASFNTVKIDIQPSTPAKPILAATTITNSCPLTITNLLDVHTETTPINTTLVWFTIDATTGSYIAYDTPETSAKGVYYAFYLNNFSGCLSPASASVTVQIRDCCVAGYEAPILQ